MTPPEDDRAMATGDLHKKFCEDHSSGSRDMIADRQTHTRTSWSQYSAPLPGQSTHIFYFFLFCTTKNLAWEKTSINNRMNSLNLLNHNITSIVTALTTSWRLTQYQQTLTWNELETNECIMSTTISYHTHTECIHTLVTMPMKVIDLRIPNQMPRHTEIHIFKHHVTKTQKCLKNRSRVTFCNPVNISHNCNFMAMYKIHIKVNKIYKKFWSKDTLQYHVWYTSGVLTLHCTKLHCSKKYKYFLNVQLTTVWWDNVNKHATATISNSILNFPQQTLTQDPKKCP